MITVRRAETRDADLPLPGGAEGPLDEWLRDEATLADGSFVALAGGEVVGYAGLLERVEPGLAEHGQGPLP